MDEMIPGRKVSDLERMTELLAPVEQVYPLTDMEVEAIRDLAHQQDVAYPRAVWQATVDALLGHSATLTTERDALRAALEGMTRVMHEVLRQHGWQAAEDTIKVAERALSGTGETP